MVKGWRNDPAWVAHYEAVKSERLQRRMDMMRAELQIAQAQENMHRRFDYFSKVQID